LHNITRLDLSYCQLNAGQPAARVRIDTEPPAQNRGLRAAERMRDTKDYPQNVEVWTKASLAVQASLEMDGWPSG
jgi:hypothetical protein